MSILGDMIKDMEAGKAPKSSAGYLRERGKTDALKNMERLQGGTPIRTKGTQGQTSAKDEQGGNKDAWLKSGAFDDGYDFGDTTKTILGTVGDFGLGAVKGIGRMAEGLVDLGTYGVGAVGKAFGADEFWEGAKKVAQYSATDEWTKGATDYVDKYSVLGNKADSISEGIGQVAAIIATGGLAGAAGLGGAGVAAVTTAATGLSSMGTNMNEAYENNATDGEAFVYGLSTGAIEAGTELLSGGLGKVVKALGISRGIGGLDDIFAKKLASKVTKAITNEGIQKVLGNTIEASVKAGGEGLEEVLSGFGSAVMKNLTYMDDKDLKELVKDEKLLEQFVVGTITSSLVQSPSYINANKTGTDFVTGQTLNQERTADKVVSAYKNAIDENLVNFVQKAKNNTTDNKSVFRLNNVNDRMAGDIEGLTGIDAKNYGNVIKANSIRHIIKDHGTNGETDSSMADDADIARIQYVIDNYDTMELLEDKSKEYRDKEQKPAPMVKISKRVNGTYYVVEAVPDTNRQELAVVTAYKKKATEQQTRNANSPHSDARNASADVAFNNNISQGGNSVNSYILGENGKKAFDANFKEGQNEELYTKGFRRMYNLGQSNIPIKKAAAEIKGNKYIQSLSPDQRMAAYYSGQNDAKLQMEAEKNAVKYVEFYSDDAGVVENDAAKKVNVDELQAIDRLARTVGAQVVFEEDIEGFNGYIELGKIHISLNAENKLAVVAAHEVTHRMQQLAPESYRKYRDFVMSTVGIGVVESYQENLHSKDIYLSDSEVMDEIAADYTKKILSDPKSMQQFVDDALNGKFDTTASIAENRNILQKLFDLIKEFIKKVSDKFSGRKAEQNQAARDAYGVDLETLKQAKNLLQKALRDSTDVVSQLEQQEVHKNGEEAGTKRFSVKHDVFEVSNDIIKKYESQVDSWLSGKLKSSEMFKLGNTPKILKALGAGDLPLEMSQDVIVKITGEKHSISLDEIKRIPSAIANPIMVFKSATVKDAFVILTELTDKSGNDVVVAMHIKRKSGFNTINRIASVYGKNNIGRFVNDQIEANNLKYIDKNKSQEWLRSRGLQLPKLNTILNSNNNILQKEDIVNTHSMQKSENNSQRKNSVKGIDEGLSQEYNDISEFIPRKMITKSNIYKFLSDKESWSEANQLAIRWANKAAVETGAQTVISYHGQWYIVEKFDSADMKYQIVGKISSKNYNVILNEVKKSEEGREVQTVQRSFDRLAALYKEGDKIERGRHSSGDITTRRDGENNTIQRVGRGQDDERKVYSDTRRGNERNGSDRENSSVKNNDRKNSIKMDEEFIEKHERLTKAYVMLNAELRRLKNEKRTFRQEKIATVAKKILKDFDFAYDAELFSEQMNGLAEDTKQMIEGKMGFDTFKSKVLEISKDVIETGAKTDSAEYQQSKVMRDYLRTTKITLSEDARNNLGDEYETIRKRTFGRLRLVKEGGTPIDVVYQELSELYPEYFSTETETNASAQLRQIQSVLDGLQSLKSDAFGGYMDEAAEWLSNLMIDQIYNEIFVSGEAGKTTVSVDVKVMRAEMADNLQRVMSRERQWREREYNKLQSKFEKKTKSYTEARQKAIKVRQIKLHTERLSKALINPSERFAVPEFLKKPVAQFLQCINLQNERMGEKTREKLRDLAKAYKTIAEQEYEMSMVVDPDLYEHLEKINDDIGELEVENKTLSDLNLDTLEALRRSVMAMEASLRNYNMLFHEGELKRVKDVARRIRGELEERQDKEYIKGTQSARDFFDFNMVNPWDFFHQLGTTFEALYQEGIREGENKLINNLDKAMTNMDEALSKYKLDVKTLEGTKATNTVFALQNGQSIELSKADVMSLYLLWRQPGARDHIMEGGIKAAKVSEAIRKKTTENGKTIVKYVWKEKAHNKSVRPSLDDVANIINSLTETEKKFAESISDFFVNECAEWGNEVALKLYGYKKFNTPNYYPIMSDKMSIATVAGESADATIKNKGFTQKRIKGANNPVIIESIFDVYARHTADMAKYNAFVLPLQDMQRVFNYVQRTDAEFAEKTESETENGKIKISVSDVKNIQSIGRKSVNDFTAEDLKKAEKFAEKYFNELGEKSPFYRAQFGDWRENDKSKSSVVSVETRNKDIPRGTFRNKDTGWDIVVSSVGIGDTVSHSGKERLSTIALNNIDAIIENSVLLDSEGSVPSGKKGANTLFMHKLFGICDIGGKKYLSKLTVEEFLSGTETNKRFYNLKEIKISSALGGLGDNNTASTMRISDDTITVADLFKIVKENDKSFNPKDYAFSMKELIATKFGEKANDYFTKLMIDINGGMKKEYEHNPMAKITSVTKKSAMGNNARVIMQQPLSYTRAGILVGWRYLAKAGLKADMDIIFKYSPIARWKSWGFFDFDTGKSMKDLIVGKKDIGDYTMWAAAKADEATWKRLWNAVELEIADKHPELQRGSDAFYKVCGKRYDEVIDRTQVVDSTLHRSQILRSKNDFVKMSTSYMSEPMKTYNIIRTEALDLASGRTTKKHFGKVVWVLGFGAVALAAITGAWDNFRSDDEEEKYWETALENLISDQIGMIPYAKDVYSILQGYDVGRMDMQLIGPLVNAFKLLTKDEYTVGYKINNLCLKVADLFGVGASSAKRTMIDMAAKVVAKSLGSEWIEYKYIEKPVYNVNGRTGIFIDTLFSAYRNGHKEHYNKIFKDMMKEGVDAKTIEKGLRERFKKSGIKETFAVPWNNGLELPVTKAPDKLGIDDMNDEQYKRYSKEELSLEKSVVSPVKAMRGNFTSAEDYRKAVNAAYSYAEETAREKAFGGKYESDIDWVNYAQAWNEEQGLEPSEYIRLKYQYNLNAKALQKLEDIYNYGIDADKYFGFYDEIGDLKPPTGQEKWKNGQKAAAIKQMLAQMDLTTSEWNALYYGAAGYKK